jgi:hypothetical protein
MKGFRWVGLVPSELNDALVQMERLLGNPIGLVHRFDLCANVRRTAMQAIVEFDSGLDVIIAFRQDYPLSPEIKVLRVKFYGDYENGVEELTRLQRMAGPIKWTFRQDRDLINMGRMGQFEYRLSRQNLANLDRADTERQYGNKFPAWDNPDSPYVYPLDLTFLSGE